MKCARWSSWSSASLARQRFLLLLFTIFAGLALLLACIGIYSVIAYLMSRRVSEFGVRLAVGAHSSDIVKLVLRESLPIIRLESESACWPRSAPGVFCSVSCRVCKPRRDSFSRWWCPH